MSEELDKDYVHTTPDKPLHEHEEWGLEKADCWFHDADCWSCFVCNEKSLWDEDDNDKIHEDFQVYRQKIKKGEISEETRLIPVFGVWSEQKNFLKTRKRKRKRGD
jgi:hypothetical protein